MNGTELLADFRERRSEGAFSELVRRYTNLVYSVAKRRLSNGSLAEEVTQMVFIRLAKAAPKLHHDAELVAWLHRTTIHVSIDLLRSEIRRRVREEKAAVMQSDVEENVAWKEIAPELDEALNRMGDADRQALLLRFFDHKAMRDVGVTLGVSEDAAKMRVSRALDRLRLQLSARGIACGAAALGTMLADRSVEAAPAQLAATLAALSFPAPASIGLGGGLLGTLSEVSKVKLASGLAAIVLVGAGILIWQHARPPEAANDASQNMLVKLRPQTNQRVSTLTTEDAVILDENGNPDPLKLLQAVARARNRITSGSMEFQLSMDNVVRGQKETSNLRLAVVFDGEKRRFESVGREYSYVAMGEGAAEMTDAKMKAQGLDREGAVRAGLLTGFESHHVTAYDGAVYIDYWENDGRPVGTTIRDPAKGNSSFNFDPRCLGLAASLLARDTIENCLGHKDAKDVRLLGTESVEGAPAWHVQVKTKYDSGYDFWIDVANPIRVLQHKYGTDVVLSKYDSAGAIPTEVTATQPRVSFTKHFTVSKAQFNMPIDPASWTLAGLGMPIGTDVSDDRIFRRVGYWTGIGLSERLPDKNAKPQTPPNMPELLASLENDPASQTGLQAAAWILLNTPDGPEVEKAADVVLREHIENPDLLYLSKGLERVRHRSVPKLLQALIDRNPNREVQAQACFILATLRKEEAKYGANKKAKAEAENLFERMISQFGAAGPNAPDLVAKAKRELSALRHLTIGNPAPEIEGEDLDGQPMKLSDYRGKVVVLHFWSHYYDEVEHHRKLVARMNEKPFVLIGVNSDKDLARAKTTVETNHVTWPSFRDGNYPGPIHTAYNVNSWPSIFVLDRNGVIRYRDLRWKELDDAVDKLLQE